MPTLDTMAAEGDFTGVEGGECQSEQNVVPFLRSCGPGLEEYRQFGEQDLLACHPIWKLLLIRQTGRGEAK